MRAAIATLNRTQFRRLQFDKSGTETEVVVRVGTRVVAVAAEHARVVAAAVVATAEEQAAKFYSLFPMSSGVLVIDGL